MAEEIVYHLSVSAKLAEKYAMYKPATDGAGKENEKNRLTDKESKWQWL
ncbi:MAG: hypothetical protein IJG84_11840 [Kiritimatiellae bacterium]|nr:hypothetical protein [Kiritimatiellia bacterium]